MFGSRIIQSQQFNETHQTLFITIVFCAPLESRIIKLWPTIFARTLLCRVLALTYLRQLSRPLGFGTLGFLDL